MDFCYETFVDQHEFSEKWRSVISCIFNGKPEIY